MLPDSLKEAPVTSEATIPEGWEVGADGTYKLSWNEREERWEKTLIAWGPVLIRRHLYDIETREERLELVFARSGRWGTVTDFRDTLFDARRVVSTARYGLPIISGTAGNFCRYLADYEAANDGSLPAALVTTSCGWKRLGDRNVFVLGDRVIGSETAPAQQEQLSFLDDHEGRTTNFKSLRESGTLADWMAVIEKIAPFPRVMFTLYASFVPPILRMLKAPNFILHHGGETSQGKTSSLEIAASVWGFPQRERGGLVQGWDSTKVYAERQAAAFNHVPLFLDDSQTTDRRVIGNVLYMLANGVGRGRGSLRSIRTTPTWETVAFSTGEHSLANVIQEGGARARVLDFWGSPFGKVPVGQLVREVLDGVTTYYGMAGPAFIAFLLANEARWNEWQKDYRAAVKSLASQFRGANSNIADRLAQYFAAVEVAGTIAAEAINLPGGPVARIVSDTMADLVGENGEVDYATRARDFIVSWAFSNRSSFVGQHCSADGRELRPPSGGYLGKWDDHEFIAFFPNNLREQLVHASFDYDAVLKQWGDRGWIRQSKGRHTAGVWLQGATQWLVVLKWDALGLAADETSDIGTGIQ